MASGNSPPPSFSSSLGLHLSGLPLRGRLSRFAAQQTVPSTSFPQAARPFSFEAEGRGESNTSKSGKEGMIRGLEKNEEAQGDAPSRAEEEENQGTRAAPDGQLGRANTDSNVKVGYSMEVSKALQQPVGPPRKPDRRRDLEGAFGSSREAEAASSSRPYSGPRRDESDLQTPPVASGLVHVSRNLEDTSSDVGPPSSYSRNCNGLAHSSTFVGTAGTWDLPVAEPPYPNPLPQPARRAEAEPPRQQRAMWEEGRTEMDARVAAMFPSSTSSSSSASTSMSLNPRSSQQVLSHQMATDYRPPYDAEAHRMEEFRKAQELRLQQSIRALQMMVMEQRAQIQILQLAAQRPQVPQVIISNAANAASRTQVQQSTAADQQSLLSSLALPECIVKFLSSPLNQVLVLGGLLASGYLWRQHIRHAWRIEQMQRRVDTSLVLKLCQLIEKALQLGPGPNYYF